LPTDIEKLVVQLSADVKQYQREMQRAQGITNSQARAIENRYRQMDRRLSSIGQSAARSLIAPLTSVAAAISVREVLQYADAWTSAKNSLAVAGVVGGNQADVLDRLYQSAQANATPVGALADLFGKAAQASDNLGASQEDLLKFSDGVATSLRVAGTGAAEASGALQQLGQLLGSSRVQAEEFNSVNDGARPILIAVAAGLDAAGGSVNKLKQLVNDGKVSGQQFFEAFLRGLPKVQAMAASATQTIEQGVTKVNNAFTRYIGQTDDSLGASQRLVAGLNALADNFDSTADVALQLASVVAGALVGRALGGMLAAVPQAIGVIGALVTAMRTGTLTAAGFSAALGPLGLVAGIVAGAALAFGNWSTAIDDATRSLADQAAGAGAIEGLIDDTRRAQEAYKSAIAATANAQSSATSSIVADTKKEFEAKKSLLELELKRQQALVAVREAELSAKSAQLKADVSGSVFTRTDTDRTGFSDPRVGRLVNLPDDITGLEKTRDVLANNPLTPEVQRLRAEIDLAEVSANKLGEALNTTFNEQGGGTKQADAAGEGKGKGAKAVKATADSRFNDDLQAVRDRTAALIEEQKVIGESYQAQERRRMALDLEQSALADLREEARKKGQTDFDNIKLSDDQRAKIEATSAAYAQQASILRQLEDQQQRNEQAADEFYDAFKSGAMDAITGAESLGDALSNLAQRFGDLLLSSAFDSLFQPATGGGSGGLFGNIFKSLGSLFTGGVPGRAKGGPVSAGKPYIVGEKRPELFVPGASGRIIPQVPTMSSLAGVKTSGSTVHVSYAPSYNVTGTGEDIDALRRQMAKDRAEFPSRAVAEIRKAQKRGVKI
jgi:tape measure domain-containing protein